MRSYFYILPPQGTSFLFFCVSEVGVYGTCVYVGTRKGHEILCTATLCLTALRQGLSVELGWQAGSSSDLLSLPATALELQVYKAIPGFSYLNWSYPSSHFFSTSILNYSFFWNLLTFPL